MNSNEYKVFFDESVEFIKQALNEQYLSIFAGAGISASSKLPMWKELIESISEMLYEEKSSEDNLILAEKFYNAYGKNKYYQKLKELTHYDSAEPNVLHQLIVKLDIKNLITTNWDNLFEKAIDEEKLFYNVIRKDEDIGYSTGFSKLIKMHGNFEDQNIVFREKDYLEYSLNFPLIENYLKGVFSTDCVVLMGYSLNDNNVKQIINWVNCKATNIKPIYFIKTDKSYDYHEFNFYKNKNIHILYLRDIEENTKIKDDQTKLLQSFLDLLTTSESFDFNKIDAVFKLEHEVDKFLDRYKECKFVHPNIFIQDFCQYFSIKTGDISFSCFTIKIKNSTFACFNNENIYKKISKLTLSKVILLQGEDDYGDEKEVSFSPIDNTDSNMLSIMNNILYFNYDKIDKEIEKISYKDDNNSLLRKAFLLYKNLYFADAYKILEYTSTKAFKEKDYISWYIAEINKEYFIGDTSFFDKYLEADYLLIRNNNLNLDNKYLKLPLNKKNILKGLKNIDIFLLQLERYSLYLKNKALSNFFKDKHDSQDLGENIDIANNIIDCGLNFGVSLLIPVGLDSMFKNIVESLLLNHLSLETKSKEIFIVNTKFISIAINCLESKKLLEILKTYSDKDIVFTFNKLDFIESIFTGICKKYNPTFFEQLEYYQRLFNNCLILFSQVKLDQKYFDSIVEKLFNKLKTNKLALDTLKYINYFLIHQCRQNKQNSLYRVSKVINSYIDLFLLNNLNESNIKSLQKMSVFSKLISTSEVLNENISIFIKDFSSRHILAQYLSLKSLFFEIYAICDKSAQSEINKIAFNVYMNLKDYIFKRLFQKGNKEITENSYDNLTSIEEYILAMLEIGFHLYSNTSDFDKSDYIDQFKTMESIFNSYDKTKYSSLNKSQVKSIINFIEGHKKDIGL